MQHVVLQDVIGPDRLQQAELGAMASSATVVKKGGDVWIHLRAFTKALFDQVPEDYFKVDGRWIERCTDYATMVPIVELARSPIYIPEYLCWHERHTLLDAEGERHRDASITALMNKPSIKRRT